MLRRATIKKGRSGSLWRHHTECLWAYAVLLLSSDSGNIILAARGVAGDERTVWSTSAAAACRTSMNREACSRDMRENAPDYPRGPWPQSQQGQNRPVQILHKASGCVRVGQTHNGGGTDRRARGRALCLMLKPVSACDPNLTQTRFGSLPQPTVPGPRIPCHTYGTLDARWIRRSASAMLRQRGIAPCICCSRGVSAEPTAVRVCQPCASGCAREQDTLGVVGTGLAGWGIVEYDAGRWPGVDQDPPPDDVLVVTLDIVALYILDVRVYSMVHET